MTKKDVIPTLDFVPVIIIGAPRSGTNILRDTLCRMPSFETWDCDEINPIWRHGHITHPHDRFDAHMATPGTIAFLRRAFVRAWKRFGRPRFLVEKTCASSLRVPFIAKAFPEARFVFLVRDGVDVVASAQKRWRGKMELPTLPYYWAKVRSTPLLDIPVYGARFMQSRLSMMLGASDHLSFWGPQYPGIQDDLKSLSLDEVCARQWVSCVEEANAGLTALPPDRVHRVAYEELAFAPEAQIASIDAFLNAGLDDAAIASACTKVSRKSVGLGRRSLGEEGHGRRLLDIMGPTLSKFGYRVEIE